jgi:hypothetical protein
MAWGAVLSAVSSVLGGSSGGKASQAASPTDVTTGDINQSTGDFVVGGSGGVSQGGMQTLLIAAGIVGVVYFLRK